MTDEPTSTPPVEERLNELLPNENPKNVSTLAIVSTVVATLNEVIAALRDEIAALGNSELRGRRRLAVLLVVLLIAAVASVAGMLINYSQGNDVKSIVRYIEECQTEGSECKKRNDEAVGKAVTAISANAFDSITCVLRTLPDERTDANVEVCRDKYLGARK